MISFLQNKEKIEELKMQWKLKKHNNTINLKNTTLKNC